MKKAFRKDLTGQTFGRLTVTGYYGKTKSGRSLWLCRCECGNEKIANSDSIKRGLTRSCDCLDREAHFFRPNRKKHGDHGTRLYRIWKAMKSRCYCVNSESYQKWYGARGITVCQEWQNDFSKFRDWALSNGYRDDLSIDRINPDGNYEPHNCRWATAKEQVNNRRIQKEGGDNQES